jgi:hypothetical protein
MKIENALKYPNARINCYRSMQNKSLIYSNIISLIANNPISDEMEFEISNSKLQLRQLSSLTDEEKVIIITYFYEGFKNQVVDWADYDNLLGCVKCFNEFIDYLRSINIDIDGLIESGEAENGN